VLLRAAVLGVSVEVALISWWWLLVLKLCREVVLQSGVADWWKRLRRVAFIFLREAEEAELHLPVMSQVKAT